MINKIKLEKIGTYSDSVEINPTEINYFYGSNGSGKTTLSKLIQEPTRYPNCEIDWLNSNIQTMVYNRDFVKDNFSQSNSIKGVFTLGKETTEAKKIIANAKNEIEKITPRIERNNKTLLKKQEEVANETEIIQNKCWTLKRKYNNIFKEVLKGSVKTKEIFFNKCLNQYNNESDLLSENTLKERYDKAFSNNLIVYPELNTITYDKLKSFESNPILSFKIIGKEDIEIGKLIMSLNNIDWVNQGIKFLESSTDFCPFCQQRINSDLKSQLEDFFDKTYFEKCNELTIFKKDYYNYINDLILNLRKIENFDINIFDINKLNEKLNLLEFKFKSNLIKLDEKINSPSISIELTTLIDDFDKISLLLSESILKIKEHNKLVKNIYTEKTILSNQIWKYIYSELEIDIANYNSKIERLSKAKKGLETSNIELLDEIRKLKSIIKEKEKQVSSTAYTVHEINRILKLFGFNNFQLAEAEENGFYKIIRPNGEDAQQTLSEGEYTFITFLYFYQLIKGSTDQTGITTDRIIVIDDPISSLDSNVLFIVSNLVKEVIKDCNEKINGIKQVFILTHNVYFHKEITFKGNRDHTTSKESFWIVRKLNGNSNINKHESNPIKTTYELLWSEIDDLNKINTATIFNTLRRILEYYFNILGSMKYEEIINQFEGEDKLVCKSLVSWINDGSHFISDDLEMPIDTDKIEKYLAVFKLIFEKMGHESHYNMMMDRNKTG
ncbi:Uncharacterized protein conserved in bacteria [Turicibacter sanguinis]|nr:Uncharacterized protein conserved in bacteria [Turicibacter sanguinis]